MKGIVLTYGIAAGAVIIAAIVLGLALGTGAGTAGVVAGYLIMLGALSLVFLGVKRYRDREQGGVIRFGQAFGVGFGIAAVASVVYVIGWEITLAATDYRFMDDYARSAVEAKRASGASAAEIAKVQADMAKMAEQYANPLFRVPITFSEILPVGLIVALASAALLRNSRFLPARG